MYILGISGYTHESSCALIKDGNIRVVLEEERFNRKKHTLEFPINAIKECLSIEGISFSDIDQITFFWNPTKIVTGNFPHFLKYFPATLNLLTYHRDSDELPFFKLLWNSYNVRRELKKHFNSSKISKIKYVEHHLAHAASAFYCSSFDEAAILTIDGRGESTTTMMARGRDNKIQKIKELKVPHSLGHLYAAITDYLGFKPFSDEWKVMGMSAYGTPSLVDEMKKLIILKNKGGFELNLKYFNFHTHGRSRWVSKELYRLLGLPVKNSSELEQKHFDIAYGLQKAVEETSLHMVNHLHSITKSNNLCMAGGVVLNSLMNKLLIEKSFFQNFFFQPIANDAGTSLGSTLYYYFHEMNQNKFNSFHDVYLGNEFIDDDFEVILKKNNLNFSKSPCIESETAKLLADGKIIGWFQGRMEAGPRALGNRSILASPKDINMKDKINRIIKKRESFRPFAPSVLEEKAHEYFNLPKNNLSPYMIVISDVKKDKKALIPAVVHVDNTARVHTVNKNINTRFWNLISEFEKLAGIPVLLNTSFNENEPIVCDPQDAINCFLRTDLDALVLGNFIVKK